MLTFQTYNIQGWNPGNVNTAPRTVPFTFALSCVIVLTIIDIRAF